VQGRGPAARRDGIPDGAHAPPLIGEAADALVRVETGDGALADAQSYLSPGSPFRTPADAARFLAYTPTAISCDVDGRWLKLAEVFRDESAWKERAVGVVESHFRFFERLGQHDLRLERATRLAAPIEYRWLLGRRLPLAPPVIGRVERPAPRRRAAA
jgi:hypothetical protein